MSRLPFLTSELPDFSRFSACETFGSALNVACTWPGPLTGFEDGSTNSVISPKLSAGLPSVFPVSESTARYPVSTFCPSEGMKLEESMKRGSSASGICMVRYIGG